jgi:hypothetical protein
MKSGNKKNTKLYDVGKKIELNKKDMYNILNNIPLMNKHISITIGPRNYMSSLYGTVSTSDFY